MAIEVKTATGGEATVASNGKANTALGLAIAGLSTALLGNGISGVLGNGVLNGGNGNSVNGECLLSKDQFYNTIIAQMNEQSARDLAVERRMSTIEAAVSQNAAVSECNKNAIRREIEVTNDKFDMTISNERIVNELILKNALACTVKGTPMISPTQIGDNYLAPHRILSSYEPREYAPAHGCRSGWGYDGGCNPCDGYRGF